MKKFKDWNWWKVGACTLAGGVLIGALTYYNFIQKETVAKVGDLCPDFKVDYIYSGQDGKMVIDEDASFWLSHQRGKVVVINFWATYCDPCIKEIPHFNELQEEYADEGLEVIILNGEMAETAESILDNYVNEGGKYHDKYHEYYKEWPTYSCTFGRYEEDNAIIDKFDVAPRWPVTIVVDREGVIAYMAAASLTYEGLEEIVLPLLEESK